MSAPRPAPRRSSRRRRLPVGLLLLAGTAAVAGWLTRSPAGWTTLPADRTAPDEGPGDPATGPHTSTGTAALPGRPRLVGVLGGSVAHGDVRTPELLLHRGRQVLGRGRDADVLLDDLTVSPNHALLEVDGEGRVVLHDLGAVNGVTVDGIPVAAVELHDGNRVQLGDVQLVYRVDPERDGGGRQGGELGEQAGR